LAESRAVAEDAAELILVDYDPLPAVASVSAALAPGAPLLHGTNVLLDVEAYVDAELDAVIADAPLVVEATFTSGRLNAVPLEARACFAEWDARDERLVLHVSTQVPHLVRLAASQLLGLSEQQIRVISPDVGGGFGQKCVVGREEMALAAIAYRLHVPVKWVEDRQENIVSGFHAREQRYEVRAAFDDDGVLLGLDVDIACDVGAYSCFPFTCGVEPLMAATELPGAYKVPRYRARARAVATNKSPIAPYRGVSRPQIVLVMERLMQKAARALGLDGVEVRRRNLIAAADFPYAGVNGLVYDPGSYVEALELCAGALDAVTWPERQAAARTEGRLLGLGFACFNERTAYGTEAFAARRMAITPGSENAHVRLDSTGGVMLMIGTHSHGQGHRTTFAQIVAQELGIEPSRVRVHYGDTDRTPHGWGTFGSRSIGIGGGAAKLAAASLAGRLLTLAAERLEVDAEDLELAGARVSLRAAPEIGIALAELAPVDAAATFDPPGTFSNATHGVELEVDPQTGAVRILRYVVVEDCGVMINPLVVEGQVLGGVAQGIAAALYEQLVYDEDGQILTPSFMDYLVPTAAEIPRVEIHHLETPCSYTVTGAKGMGEGGTIGAPAAIANAVSDALGVDFDSVPIRPEQVLGAVEA
jgi:carbon-monoxide dehydrogenase large subunit